MSRGLMDEDALDSVRDMASPLARPSPEREWYAALVGHIDAQRDIIRALVEAMDAQVAASLQGDDRTEADTAFARALTTARGVL